MKNQRTASIRRQIVSVNVLVVAVTILLAMAGSLFVTLDQNRVVLDRNLMNSAQMAARLDVVVSSLTARTPADALPAHMDGIVHNVNDIDTIAVADLASTLVYYPDHALIGQTYTGADQSRILAGEGAFTSKDTGNSGAERCAYAPVTDSDGTLLGFVMVGVYMRSVTAGIARTVLTFAVIALAAAALGVFLSVKLSDRIKHTLMDREPDDFLALFHEREDILEALEEGILAIDPDETVSYLNSTAAAMLSLDPKKAVGRPLHAVYPQSTLDRVLKKGAPEYNVPLRSLKSAYILSDRIPVLRDKQVVGAVAIFRNRTEVNKLAEDLTGVRHMVEAMRAYTHEFMNKLHVILGLIQIGEPEKAERYILDASQVQREAVGRIMEKIREPSVAALLVGKTSRCAELGVSLVLERSSSLSAEQTFLPVNAYVTILGNLIENAVDALGQTVRGEKQIRVSLVEEEARLLLCVEDTGPGMDRQVLERIFRLGFSTKGSGHGTGLALVAETVAAYQGSIRCESEPGVGSAFFITFTRREDEICIES